MVIHKHVDGADSRFSTMEVPLAKNPLENGLELSEEGPNNQRLKVAGGHMNQCLIYGQTYSLVVTSVMVGQMQKEAKTRRIRSTRNSKKWY